MAETKLLQIIEAGESERVEFKREMERPERLAREVVALANRAGGMILVGVDDDRAVVGVSLRDDYTEWVANVGAQSIRPPLHLTCKPIITQGKTILVINVPQGQYKPHCVREGEHKCTVYVRHGTTTRVATREEIGSLYQEGGIIDFDLSIVANATIDDLNVDLLADFARAKVGVQLDDLPDLQQQLVNWNILREYDGQRGVTLTGMLFFGKKPGNFVPQARLWLKRFKGLDITAWYPGKEIAAPIPLAIQTALEFINSYTVIETIQGAQRVATGEYLEPVVREAIVNAIAHRNYVPRGERIRIFMFDDRIEVHSPGPLPNGITVEKMRYGIHKTRNPNIVHYLRVYGYWEGDGLGVPRMISQCRSNGIREPRFELRGDELVVTLYSRRYDEFHPAAR